MGNDWPRVLNQRQARRLLEDHGWTSTKGAKHEKMTKPGCRPVTLPRGSGDYSPWLTRRILKEAGLVGADGSEGDDDEQ